MPSITITWTIELTDQQCWNVLTTAYEGGYAEEFDVVQPAERAEDLSIMRFRATCSDHGPEGHVYFFDVDAVARGFKLLAEKYGASGGYLGEQVRIAFQDGIESLDAIGADAVLQMAAWGEIVFG